MPIRKANIHDLPRVYALICQLEDSALNYQAFSQIYTQALTNDTCHYLVATQGDNAIGFLNLCITPHLHHARHIAEVMELVIDPLYRNAGTGSQLFDHAVEIAKHYHCQQLELSSNILRTHAHRFYLRKGMHQYHYKFSLPLDGDGGENRIGGV